MHLAIVRADMRITEDITETTSLEFFQSLKVAHRPFLFPLACDIILNNLPGVGGWVVFQALPAESSNYTGEGGNLGTGLLRRVIS